jgi:hypothetical protein
MSYIFKDKALRVMKAENVSVAEATKMLNDSAITSLHGFNRRYHHLLFKLVGEEVLDIVMPPVVEIGNGRDKVYEEHDPCDGSGCRQCNHFGFVYRRITV